MPSFSLNYTKMLPRLKNLTSSLLLYASKSPSNRLTFQSATIQRFLTSQTGSILTKVAEPATSTFSSSKVKLSTSSNLLFATRSASLSSFATPKPFLNGGIKNNHKILLSSKSSSSLLQNKNFNVTLWQKSSLHTEVDAELSRFLEKEIKLGQNTKKYPTTLPLIQGFDILTDNAKVTLTKNLGNEKITVNLNINHSVDADENEMLNDQKDEDVTQMVSRPPFTVEINQGEKEVFALQCSFPSAEFDEDQSAKDEENMMDLFQIDEVTIHEGEWSESMYSLGAETMDGNLYDLLMDMLDERGINDEFINQLMDFCTVYEHKRYLTFLDGIKKFVDKK